MASSNDLVAIITGGASGIGLEAGKALVARGNWKVYLLDRDGDRGRKAAASLGSSAQFLQTDVSKFEELRQAFRTVFDAQKRLNFVFANAGIVDTANFYEEIPAGEPEREIAQSVMQVNLQAATNASHLALRFFRLSGAGPKDLVVTGSVGSLYPCFSIPMYTASKHGVLGFVRSIAPRFYAEGIKVNALLPGVMATGLLTSDEFTLYPQDSFTPVEYVIETVLRVLDNEAMTDAYGVEAQAGKVYGKAIEVNVRNFYFREQASWCDESMERIMATTEHDLGG